MKTKITIIAGLVMFMVTMCNLNLRAQYLFQDTYAPNTFAYITECAAPTDNSNRLFVVQQRGLIYILNTASPSTPKKLFIDLSDRVSSSGSELGCLGLAFHPNYSTNRYFYVSYTQTASPYNSVIARYQVSPTNPDSALKSTEFIIMTVNQPYSNHNGGHIAFGPDGYFYFGLGDGGSEGDPNGYGQNKSSKLSKILRIDVNTATPPNNYTIPASNPWFGNINGWVQEMWCWGMRNPWKFNFDANNSGDMWIGDVGQNQYEEIDRGGINKNFGWSTTEGFHCYNPSSGCDTSGKSYPVFEYTHSVGNSITGGYVYRGNLMPELVGKYIYADYGSGKIWALTGSAPYTNLQLGTLTGACGTFGQDNQKNVYACSYSSTSSRVYKIYDTRVGIGNVGNVTPTNFELMQNFPNPFNPSTKITFALPENSIVTLKVYDVTGKVVSELVSGETMSAGAYTREFDGSKLGSGVYYYKIEAGNFTETKKMLFVK